MCESFRQSLIESLRHPERNFRLYLRQNAHTLPKRKELLELELHPVYSQAITYFLIKQTENSGFANLKMSSEVVRKDQKISITWESGISEKKYLEKQHLDKIKDFFQGYYDEQIVHHIQSR